MKQEEISKNQCCGFGHESVEEVSEVLAKRAAELEDSADDASQLQQLIDVYKTIISMNPFSYKALWKAGNYHILMGAAYANTKKEKKREYMSAVQFCKNAMECSSEFREKIRNGAAIHEAIDLLGKDYTDAMGYWYTARFYYFRECLSPFSRILNTRLVMENNKVIRRIELLEPDWAAGGNYLSKAIYYIAAPERFGGSKIKAAEEFEKALQAGPDYMVNYWARAKYLHTVTRNIAALHKDLEKVLSMDPRKSGNTYAWNMYFLRDAKKILSQY